MTQVDPFIIPIPDEFLQDTEKRVFFEYLIDFLFKLWTRSGGGDDLLETTINQTITGSGQAVGALGEIFNKLQESRGIEPTPMPQYVEYNPVTASSNYTAAPYDFVNAKNNCQITLPDHGSVIVRNGDNSRITIWANGRNINGQSALDIRRQGTALFMQYFIDDNEWLIR